MSKLSVSVNYQPSYESTRQSGISEVEVVDLVEFPPSSEHSDTHQPDVHRNGEGRSPTPTLQLNSPNNDTHISRSLYVALIPVRTNEILVTTPSPGVREITYSGSDEIPGTGQRPARKKLREYRSERIPALPRKLYNEGDCDFSPEEEDKYASLRIATDYPSIFFVGDYKDDIHSILDVLTGQKMSTFVLDAYLSRRIDYYNQLERNRGSNSVFSYIPLLFFPIFDQDQNVAKMKPNESLFPKNVISSASNDYVLIAPLYVCKHFYVAIFYLTSREIRILDSCWKFVPLDLRLQQVKKIANFISVYFGSSCDSWNITLVERCAQQLDEYSCGCYVISFIENEINGEFKKSETKMKKSEIEQIRVKIVSELLPTSTVGCRLLSALTM